MGNRVRRALCLTALAALLVVLSAGVFPNFINQNKKMAEDAVEQFHGYYNAEQFRQVYSQTAPEFKAFTSEAGFLSLLEFLRLKLGLSS